MSFTIKQGDLAPNFTATLQAPAGSPVDLTGTSIKFVMTAMGATSATINAAATIVGDPTLGNVEYVWQSGDTSVVDLYLVNFVVTFAGNIPRTFPEDDYLYVNIIPKLA